ncbi:NfeD family protein [Demequina sp.]|uniref:NfeD family protein n=1 Tax=Demequina sp. TaxID=2050685 RepID=UPI003D1383EC
MNPSLWWFVGAMLLGILEIFTLDLTFAMLAGGALAGGLAALFGADLWLSIVIFAVVSALLLFVLRPSLMKHFRTGAISTGTAALVGRTAIALDEVTTRTGRVKLNGEVWTARTLEGAVAEDAYATVLEIKGAMAIVAPAADDAVIDTEEG